MNINHLCKITMCSPIGGGMEEEYRKTDTPFTADDSMN